MITIIFAPPGFGKTVFMTYMLYLNAFDKVRNRKMRLEILKKQASGFKNIKTIPVHCVSANYDCCFKKFGYSPRYSRRINPYRLGFDNSFVKTHFNLPFECIGITEAQKYLNSRLSVYFPDWQSRWYEMHRHDDLDIWLDTQRPMLIDVNVRELARFIEIVNLKVKTDKAGKVISLTWKIRVIENSSLFEKYMSSGKKDKSCYVEEKVVADCNVFSFYDSQSAKPKFYAGHFDEDFDYKSAEIVVDTLDGYIEYLKKVDDELPKDYFNRRKSA